MGMTTVVQNSPTPYAERPIQKIVLPGQTPDGEHIFGILVKRTYDIVPGSRCTRAMTDGKLFPGDVHYDDPVNSTVKFESDFIPFKLATDVVLNGRAHAPRGQRVATLRASLTIGQHRKEVLVFGDRVARYNGNRDPAFTEPRPFESMELRYERAYGGVDIYSEPRMPFVYPRNHLGCGYVVANMKRSVEGLALPNFEDPNDLLTPERLCVGDFKKWERQPMPQGFGWTMKTWRPRSSYAGIMPADRALEKELRTAYSALVPSAQRKLYKETHLSTIDFRFFNGASAGLVFPFLSGTEQVHLLNLAAQGDTQFQLPGERPSIGLDIGQGTQEPEVFLHTVLIRMDDRQVDLVWRGAVPYPGRDWLPEMKKMEVLIE